MDNIKTSFIRLALQCKVLKFGEFKLKSGRLSPYFFNAGLFYQGSALQQLGQFYAQTLIHQQIPFQHLFGPAYKGFSLATATAVALAEHGVDVSVTFNRKEVKSHGEGGQLIGSPLSGNTVIIDDVITAGTAFREAQHFIQEHGGKLTAIIIALDRCERGLTDKSAIEDIRNQGIEVMSIITLHDLIAYLQNQNETELVNRLVTYQQQYGVVDISSKQ